MNFHSQRGVVKAVDHAIGLLLSLHTHLEYLQFLRPIHRLPIIVEDGCGVQGFGIDLVAVVLQPNDDGVRVEYDLHILCLFDVTIQPLDGERDKVVPIIPLESQWDCIMRGTIASLVQGEACHSGHIWGFIRVVRVFKGAYELVLSWVQLPLAHVAVGAAPWAAHCQCAARRSASHAAILALLLVTALANCSSLHVEHTFLIASCVLVVLKRDW